MLAFHINPAPGFSEDSEASIMTQSINPEDSGEDSEAHPGDDALSTVSRASTTFSKMANELADENRILKQAALTAQNDIDRLKTQLEAAQLAIAQAATREREAEERARRQAETQALAARAAETQIREAAARQIAEEKLARENVENQARVTQIRLAEFERAEAEKKAAEGAKRQAEILRQRQLEAEHKAEIEARYADLQYRSTPQYIAAQIAARVQKKLSYLHSLGRGVLPGTPLTEQLLDSMISEYNAQQNFFPSIAANDR